MRKLPFDEGYLLGLLIGDGSIIMEHGEPRFRLYTTNGVYIEWLDSLFGDFVDRVERNDYDYRGDNRAAFELFSKPHPRIEYYAEIYDNDKMYPLPKNTGPSPGMVKMWHASDGTLNWPYGAQNPTLQLATDSKHPVEQKYAELFAEIGVEMKSSTKQFYFSVDDTDKLLSYMGHAVPGFEYKWETSSEEMYKRVKEFSG